MTSSDETIKVGVYNQDWVWVEKLGVYPRTVYYVRRERGELKVKLKRGPDRLDHDEVRRLAEEALASDHPHYRTRVRAAGRDPDKEQT